VTLSDAHELAVALEAQAEGDRPSLGGAIVDMAARRFDGAAAIEQVAAARLPVIAVAQHDDQLTRRRALAAGATRCFSYRKFFEDGPHLVAGWLERAGTA
jgi:CheY-like chemotaxis protein